MTDLSKYDNKILCVFAANQQIDTDDDAFSAVGYSFADSHYRCKELSLMPGWKGKMANVDKYLDDENSIELAPLTLALFKDGKIVPVDKIYDEYETEASESLKKTQAFRFLSAMVPESARTDSALKDISTYANALDEWWDLYEDGKIKNFGWILVDTRSVTVFVAKPYSEADKIAHPAK